MTIPRNLSFLAEGASSTGVLGTANGGTGATSLTGLSVGTATNLAGGGAGQVPYNTGSGATSFLAAGTSGYYLKSNGTSAPSWAAVSSGALTKIATGSISGTTLVTTGISSTYKYYKLAILNCYDSSGGGNFQMQIVFYANGSIDTNSVYRNQSQFLSSGSIATLSYGTADGAVKLSRGDSGNGYSSQYTTNIEFSYDPSYYIINGSFATATNSANYNYMFGLLGYYGTNGANQPVTGFQIYAGTANNGTWVLYGYN